MRTIGKAVVAALAVLAVVLALLLGFGVVGGHGSGRTALHSWDFAWGVSKTIDPIGDVWSAGGVPICTDRAVTLTSITPVVTRGQIRVGTIVVRLVHRTGSTPATAPIGTYPGVPPGGKSPAGSVIPSAAPCRWPHGSGPFYEVVVPAARTGARGGYLDGLRVRYRVGSRSGEYVIRFSYALCGKDGPGPCHSRGVRS